MKKRIMTILLLIVMIGMVIVPVCAKPMSNFQAGENVKVNESIDSTSFIAGNNVEVESDIDGASFIAGNNIKLSSTQDILFAAGNIINIETVTAKDAFLAGSIINIQQSNIRDLYAAGETIRIDSNISRNVYAGGESIIINSKIDGDVNLAAEKIEIGKDAVINGTLKYEEGATINIIDGSKIEKTEVVPNKTVSIQINPVDIFMEKVISFITILVTGLILLVINKKVLKKIDKMKNDFSTIAKTVGMGFLFLIVTPIAAIIVLCTLVGIPLSIITLLLYGILIYLSVIPTAYYLGKVLLKDKIENTYLLFAVSLLIIFIVKLIPIVGGIVSFLSLCFGLGIDTILIKDYIKQK